MRSLLLAGISSFALVAGLAKAETPSTVELCQPLRLTTGSAYTADNVVGSATGTAGGSGVINLNTASSPGLSGIATSIRLNFAEFHTEEFDVTPLSDAPSSGTILNDNQEPSLSTTGCSTYPATSCDPFLVITPIKLTNHTSLLGPNGTNYGTDLNPLRSGYFVITTPNTPTFTNAIASFCVVYRKDF